MKVVRVMNRHRWTEMREKDSIPGYLFVRRQFHIFFYDTFPVWRNNQSVCSSFVLIELESYLNVPYGSVQLNLCVLLRKNGKGSTPTETNVLKHHMTRFPSNRTHSSKPLLWIKNTKTRILLYFSRNTNTIHYMYEKGTHLWKHLSPQTLIHMILCSLFLSRIEWVFH